MKDFLSTVKPCCKIENVLHSCVLFIVLVCVVVAGSAVFRPIDTKQYQKIVQLAGQEHYPDTQDMAGHLLTQQNIYSLEYFRLLHAWQTEQAHVKEYPALKIEDNIR